MIDEILMYGERGQFPDKIFNEALEKFFAGNHFTTKKEFVEYSLKLLNSHDQVTYSIKKYSKDKYKCSLFLTNDGDITDILVKEPFICKTFEGALLSSFIKSKHFTKDIQK